MGTQGDTRLEKALKGINNISPDSGWLEGVLQEAGLGLFYVKLRCGILGQKFSGLDIAWTITKVQVHWLIVGFQLFNIPEFVSTSVKKQL